MRKKRAAIIISSPKKEYNSLLDKVQSPVIIENIITEIRKFVDCEKQRPDNNNFYREIFMPISVLKRVYVKNNKQKSVVEAILNQKGYKHIPVEVLA